MIFERHQVAQFLLDHVADHADGFCTDHVERVGVDGGVFMVHQGKQADLRAVAVGGDEVVVALDEAHEDLGDLLGVALVILDCALLAPLHERVPAHGDEHEGSASGRLHENPRIQKNPIRSGSR